jgi:hypothetical protein
MERVVLLMTKEMKERLTKEAEADRRSISNYIITHYIEKVALQTQAPATQGLGEIKVIEKEVIKEVDSVVSKLPKRVLDFYQEQALDRDGDLINCLVKNLIERAINSGVKLSEDSYAPATTTPAGGIKITEISEENLNSIAKANQKLAEIDKKKQNI